MYDKFIFLFCGGNFRFGVTSTQFVGFWKWLFLRVAVQKQILYFLPKKIGLNGFENILIKKRPLRFGSQPMCVLYVFLLKNTSFAKLYFSKVQTTILIQIKFAPHTSMYFGLNYIHEKLSEKIWKFNTYFGQKSPRISSYFSRNNDSIGFDNVGIKNK